MWLIQFEHRLKELTKQTKDEQATGTPKAGVCNCPKCLSERVPEVAKGTAHIAFKDLWGHDTPWLVNLFMGDNYTNALHKRRFFDHLRRMVEATSIGSARYTDKIFTSFHTPQSILVAIYERRLSIFKQLYTIIPADRRVFCDGCGRPVDSRSTTDRGTMPDGKSLRHLCGECKHYFKKCGNCNHAHFKSDINENTHLYTVDSDGKRVNPYRPRNPQSPSVMQDVCKGCCENELFNCRVCGGYHKREVNNIVEKEFKESPNGLKTSYIIVPYKDKTKKESLDVRKSIGAYGFIDDDCARRIAQPCHVCGTDQLNLTRNPLRHDSVYDTQQGTMCHDCAQYSRSIQNYTWKPTPVFFFDQKTESEHSTNKFFGVELEFEVGKVRDYTTKDISAILRDQFEYRFSYLKTDSSLDQGLELITSPFSYAYHLTQSDNWDSVYEQFDKMGIYIADTCGMHVHMPKAAFTTAHLYKFCKWIYDPNHFKAVLAISERKATGLKYCKLDRIDVQNTAHMAKKRINPSMDRRIIPNLDLHHARRAAINLSPSNTVEFRMFRAPETSESFNKNIEFMDSLFWFTKDVSIKNNTLNNWIDYVIKHTNYKNLQKTITNKIVTKA